MTYPPLKNKDIEDAFGKKGPLAIPFPTLRAEVVREEAEKDNICKNCGCKAGMNSKQLDTTLQQAKKCHLIRRTVQGHYERAYKLTKALHGKTIAGDPQRRPLESIVAALKAANNGHNVQITAIGAAIKNCEKMLKDADAAERKKK